MEFGLQLFVELGFAMSRVKSNLSASSRLPDRPPVEDLDRIIHNLLMELNKKILSGRFLGRSDLVTVLRKIFRASGEVLLETTLPTKTRTKRIIPLCVRISPRRVRYFKTNTEFHAAADEFPKNHSAARGKYFVLRFASKSQNSFFDDFEKYFITILDLVISNTLHKINNDRDLLSKVEVTVTHTAEKLASCEMLSIEERTKELFEGLKAISPLLSSGNVISYLRSKGQYQLSNQIKGVDDQLAFKAAVAGCLKSLNITLYEGRRRKFILIPIERALPDRLLNLTNALFVIEVQSSTKNYKLEEVSSTVRGYVRSYKDVLKNILYSSLERYLLNGRKAHYSDLNWSDVQDHIKTAVEQHAPLLMFLTNAHSIVYRSFIASERLLRPVVDRFYGDVGHTDVHTDIQIRNYTKSCNAFTFVNCSYEEGSIYIPDTNNVPEEYQRRGLRRILRRRKGTRSELTIPLFFRQIPLGTINIESSQLDNFLYDRQYVVQLVRMIGRSTEALITSFDARWIGEVAQSRAAMHEARQITYAEIISSDLKPLYAKNRKGIEHLHALIEAALARPQFRQGETLPKFVNRNVELIAGAKPEARKNLHVQIDWASDFQMQGNAHVAYIVKETIQNYVNSYSPCNRLVIRYYKQTDTSEQRRHGLLYIETSIKSSAALKFLSVIGLKPIYFQGKLHLGLYLTGVLARSCGGWMHIEESQEAHSDYVNTVLSITVRVPLTWGREA